MRCLVRSAIALSAVTAAVVAASPCAFAQAQTISYTATVSQRQVAFSGVAVTLNKFDTNLGTLIGVNIQLDTTVNANIRIFNPDDGGGVRGYTAASAAIPVNITGPSNLNLVATATASVSYDQEQQVQPGQFVTIPGLTSSGTASTDVDPSGFAAYQGPGTQTVQLTAGAGNATASGTGDPNLFYAANGQAGANIRITYTYVIEPEPSDIGLLSTGLGVVGFAIVRRRRRQK